MPTKNSLAVSTLNTDDVTDSRCDDIAYSHFRRVDNPKTDARSNTEKDPDDWVSGDEPMAGAQASYLKTLCEQAHRPHDFHEHLTKAEASKLIDEMRTKAGAALPS